MANIFSKTKGNMQYLFKSKDTLSKKERRRKRRAWATLIGLIIVFIQIILSVLFLLKVFKLDILPMKYLIMLNIVLVLLFLYDFTSQFTRAHIFGKIISVVLSGVILFTYLFAAKLDAVFTKLEEPDVNVDIVDVCVLANDRASTINDLTNYSFAYNSASSNGNVLLAFDDIKNDTGKKITPTEYTTWSELIDAFYANRTVQAIVINDSMRNIISQEYEDFEDEIKIIKSYQYKELVNVDKSNVNVKKDPFVIYVSGISSEDGADTKLSSYALSDVNILAVINPNTKQVLLVTTPRDSYIKISNNNGATGYDKLTHAGLYGIERSIEALENLYGVNIDYYVKINFSGCEAVVDALDGITIDSEVEFTNGQDAAPIAYHFVKGLNECDGAKTVAFTRERHAFLSGDFQRGRNQTAAIKAIINKATSPAILTKYSAVLDAVSDMFLTNIPNSAITDLVKAQINDPTAWNIQTYGITGDTSGKTGEHLEVTNLYNASVVYPYKDDINTAIKLMSKIANGDVFDVDEYIESLDDETASSTTSR